MAQDPSASSLDVARQLSHIDLLGSLAEKVVPRHTALLIVDMQNDFCARGGLVDLGGRDVSAVEEMARHLPALIEAAREHGVLAVFVRSLYSTGRNAFLSDSWLEQAARKQGDGYTLRPVCREGSWEGDYYGDIRPGPDDIVVTKHRYSAFHATDLDLILRSNGIRTVVVTGVSTNVCVESTARDAFMRDYYSVLVGDGTAAYSADEHATTLKTFDRFFGEVTTIAELQRLWSGGNTQAALLGFRTEIAKRWYRVLTRRNERTKLNWTQMKRLIDDFLAVNP
jgi:ureidoacrylate peracid hydrolase